MEEGTTRDKVAPESSALNVSPLIVKVSESGFALRVVAELLPKPLLAPGVKTQTPKGLGHFPFTIGFLVGVEFLP